MPLPALGESNIQFREAWKIYARGSPAGEVIEIPGLTITDANLSWVFVNVAFLTEAGDLERHAQEAIAHFASDGRPYALFVCEDYLSNESSAALTGLGLSRSLDLVGMAADSVLPPVRPLPAVETRRTDREETRRALADLNAAAYGVPMEWAREVLLRPTPTPIIKEHPTTRTLSGGTRSPDGDGEQHAHGNSDGKLPG